MSVETANVILFAALALCGVLFSNFVLRRIRVARNEPFPGCFFVRLGLLVSLLSIAVTLGAASDIWSRLHGRPGSALPWWVAVLWYLWVGGMVLADRLLTSRETRGT